LESKQTKNQLIMLKKYSFLLFFIVLTNSIAQTNYAVSSIPFTQYTGSVAVQGTLDDHYSDVITLPFNFDFYGVTYNQILISTNGYIDFRTNLANGSSPFAFSQAIPNAAFPVKNSIFGAFQDLNNANAQGTITYATYGTAPYRKFIVYFNNNSLFACNTYKSSFQMVLYESQSIIDVQLIDKQNCPSGSSKSVTGLIDLSGAQGIAAPSRNTGSWTAFHEGWRFSRPGYYTNYAYVKCDPNNDGFESFNLQVVQNDLSATNPSGISFYATLTDAQTQSNPLPSTYYNSTNPQTIYAVGNGVIKSVVLTAVDCTNDYDNDTVATDLEDVNADTNLANDDTDVDGIPNYLDNDDDGDMILTNIEYVFTKNANSIVDSDNDGLPNYLDNDDDGDGVLTFKEDYNNNGNPADDDTNTNGIPDYLDVTVALSTSVNSIQKTISLFPNPTSDVINIDNPTNSTITNAAVYSISGALVKEVKTTNTIESISVSELQSGIYFVKLQVNEEIQNYKFVKK